jgi:hypothetical protein
MPDPQRRKALGVLSATALVAALLGGVVPASGGSTARTAAESSRMGGSMPVTAADIAEVQAVGWMLTTRAGARVQVVHVPGEAVLSTYLAEVRSVDTDGYKSHDMLVVRSTDKPAQIGGRRPRDPNVPNSVVSLVIDATNGRVLNTGLAPAGHDDFQDNRQFGPTTDVVITNPASSG